VAGCGPVGEPPQEAADGQSEPAVRTPKRAGRTGVPEAQRPNVIWILLDACRADHLSCYGYGRETSPNIDTLALRGVLFEEMHTQCNITRLSVPSFLTGRYFPRCSFDPVHWRAMSRVRPPEEQYISEILSENGYRTLIVTAHPGISPKSELRGAFDEYIWVRARPGEKKDYGAFEIAIDNGEPDQWVWCDGFRFVRIGEDHAAPETPGEAKDTEDALRAIGYLQ
jgi:arylsulfatase A-like enzyme